MNRLKSLFLALIISLSVTSFAALAEADMIDGVSDVKTLEDGAICVTAKARGIESDVVLDIILDKDGAVTGISVISHGETPALGGMALSEDYLSSYKGAASVDDIDAYAGATITSDAIKECVNKAFMQYKSINGIEFEAPLTNEEKVENAVISALGDKYEEIELESYVDARIKTVYSSENGYAVYTEGTGHEKELPMKLVVASDTKGIITKITVIESNETEGIGSRVLADTNLAFYEGGRNFTLIDMGDMDKTKIDVVSGATETSFGVFKMINFASQQIDILVTDAQA